jgi:hypothetical protein
MSKDEFVCFCCGMSGAEEAKEYEHEEYEALICVNCGSFWDYSGFQEATDWSKEFVNLEN